MPIDAAEETCVLLGALPTLISAATVARSTPDFASRPIIRLELDADERALISEIHDASDWVFTVESEKRRTMRVMGPCGEIQFLIR